MIKSHGLFVSIFCKKKEEKQSLILKKIICYLNHVLSCVKKKFIQFFQNFIQGLFSMDSKEIFKPFKYV